MIPFSVRNTRIQARKPWLSLASACAIFASLVLSPAMAADPIRIVFLGDKGHHRPADLAGRIVPALKTRGIEIDYTEDANVLAGDKLKSYDGLLIYANIDQISPEQEKGLLDYVASGKGFIPLHCATFCFRNSEAYVSLCGAQFKSHGGEEFDTVNVAPDHPIMKGFGGFRSWDETYVHTKHNEKDRVVLEVRRQGGQAAGKTEEPWTWVRTHGKGRVFYTAWGHDARTWAQPGFHNLLERGIRWAVGQDPSAAGDFVSTAPEAFQAPKMNEFRKDVKPFSYTEVGAKIPNYVPGQRGQGRPHTSMQDPLPAEESIKHYITPQQFQPELWASEPALGGKPIAMNWDERGRLWICETMDYPNELQPPGKGRDRIRICEDTNGDGKADKYTIFVDKLSIPTTIVIFGGGAILQDGTKTLYLKDIDGDDVADMQQELITGWDMRDTHGGVSNFQYGPDNWIWAMQGYNDSRPVINGERQQGFRQGFWRFRVEPGPADDTAPVVSLGSKPVSDFAKHTIRVRELEFIRATNNNTWGLGISEEGLIFGSTANGNPSNFMPIPNRYYERVKGWSPATLRMISDTYKFNAPTDKIRQVDWHGGYTAGAGHALYTARTYPKSWWNRLAFVCEPTAHLVGAFVLQRDGAGYKSSSPFNLVASDDEWAAPIMAEIGPDGNVWVLDWYNYIVQHNPTPQGFSTGKGNAYESDLRDKRHGRIYRLIYQGTSEPMSDSAKAAIDATAKGLASADSMQLIAALSHPTMRWRLTAQRLLIQNGVKDPKAVEALVQLATSEKTDGIGLNVGAMHALWTLHGLGMVQAKNGNVWAAVEKALKSPVAGVRRAAIQVLPRDNASAQKIISAGLQKDSDPQVRLAAFLQISDATGSADQVAQALSKIDESSLNDPWLLDAWTSAVAMRADEVLPLLLADKKAWPEILSGRIGIIASHMGRSKPTADQFGKLLAAIDQAEGQNAFVVLDGLAKGWPNEHEIQVDEATGANLVKVLEKLPVSGKSVLVQLAGRLGARSMKDQIEKIANQLLVIVDSDAAKASERIDAARQLIIMQPSQDAIVDTLLGKLSPQMAPNIASGMIQALTGSRSPRVATALIEKLASMTPELKDTAIRVLMARPETTRSLLSAIEQGKVALNDLQLDQRQALRDHPDRAIRDLAKSVMQSGGGIPNADRAKVIEQWVATTEEKGDGVKGKELFKKHCALCHQHTGEGQNIGPDLTGMAVHPKHELLVNILDPNRSVEGNFRIYSVLTTEGLVITGMLAGESRTTVELIDAKGQRQSISRDDIEKLTGTNKSLMPEGFESQMSKEEMKDLLEFLATKGKYVPLPLNKVATAVSTKGLFSNGDDGPDRMVFSDWKPKTIEGVPFVLVDPMEKRVPNIVLLHGPNGPLPPKMPKSVAVTCNTPAKAIHLLSGVSGWGFPYGQEKTVSMIVRLHYVDGSTEDHPLRNGEHFADYIRRVDVPGSKFAARLRDQQIRYLKVEPKKTDSLKQIELVKGPDDTAPIVMAITVETDAH
ncbi:MAG: PVC-type heme-binding CxxCH protein [Pirellulales bacterium]